MIKQAQTWRAALQAAMQETDPVRAAEKTRAAEAAIARRMQICAFSPDPGFAEEQDLFDALDTIRLLKSARSRTHA